MSANPSPRPLPPFLRELLASPPRRGDGLHSWLFCAARQLHAHGTAEEITQLLAHVCRECGVRPGEIEEAVHNSKASAWQPGSVQPSPPHRKWPERDHHLRAELLRSGGGLARLIEASPLNKVAGSPDAEELIDRLFPGNPLLCYGSSAASFDTKLRETWRGHAEGTQFIVPSPMLRERGVTKEGKPSARCLDNTGPRRFLVVEFDDGSKDEHATLLLHLALRGPLALVVHSGGKSLHGWFPCLGRSDEELRPFFAYAVKLGADPATFSLCQQVRMPGGTRDNGKLQEVLFFRPEVLQCPS
jgi:hypothetical protein